MSDGQSRFNSTVFDGLAGVVTTGGGGEKLMPPRGTER